MYFPLLLKWQNPILQSTVTCLKRFPLIRKNVSLSTIWKKYQCRAFSWYGRNCFQRQYRRCEKSDWFLISRNQSLFSCTFFCFCFFVSFSFRILRFSDFRHFSFLLFLLFRARSKQFVHHCNDSSCCDKEIREIICDPFQMFIFQAKSHIIYNVSANEPIEHITDRACRHQ